MMLAYFTCWVVTQEATALQRYVNIKISNVSQSKTMSNILHLHRLWFNKESVADARNNTCHSPSKEREQTWKRNSRTTGNNCICNEKIYIINPNQKSPGNPRPPIFFPFPCKILVLLIHSLIYSLVQPTLTTCQIFLWVLERSR